jgi:hypothetical protein
MRIFTIIGGGFLSWELLDSEGVIRLFSIINEEFFCIGFDLKFK